MENITEYFDTVHASALIPPLDAQRIFNNLANVLLNRIHWNHYCHYFPFMVSSSIQQHLFNRMLVKLFKILWASRQGHVKNTITTSLHNYRPNLNRVTMSHGNRRPYHISTQNRSPPKWFKIKIKVHTIGPNFGSLHTNPIGIFKVIPRLQPVIAQSFPSIP